MQKWQRIQFQPVRPLGKDGRVLSGSVEHTALSRKAAAEGAVLLKNQDSVLPFAFGQHIAVFGKAQQDYVRGGWGSGDVTVAFTQTPLDGFDEKAKAGKLTAFPDLTAFYRQQIQKQVEAGAEMGRTTEPAVPEELQAAAKAYTDTAVIILSRISGEGSDRTAKPDDGDYYLSPAEQALIKSVTADFAKVVVVLDTGGMMDTSWFKDNDQIQSVLLAGQGGITGGGAIADLLCGDVNPSGKLVDTYADDFTSYPSSAHFNDSDDYVDYTEDIYVGYRFFETLPGQAKHVNYPFGFGLSYTTFEVVPGAITDENDQYQVTATVKNTGKVAGKEVLQLYVKAPQGLLGKASRSLAAYQKTAVIQPGTSQTVTLSVDLKHLASYDDTGKVQKSAYLLEAGDYEFYLGTDVASAQVLPVAHHEAQNRVVLQLQEKCAPHQLAKRLLADGSYEELPISPDPEEYRVGNPVREKHELDFLRTDDYATKGAVLGDDRIRFSDVANGKATLAAFMAQLTNGELISLLCGQPAVGVTDTGGFGNLPEFGVPNVTTADGPAGERIAPDRGVTTTAWPSATTLASTWNPALVSEVGRAAALELKENNVGVWLAPAMNIHRSPLCGRNFEYYSEDPLIAGTMASAMVKGVQSEHIGACIKHFCCNNKETNRNHVDSRVSERALREIYLKGFEIAVKTADPDSLMTSYNRVNGDHPSAKKELIDGILRKEWGFDGLVMTDWWNQVDQSVEIQVGNNLKMADGDPVRILAACKAGKLTRDDLSRNASYVLKAILKLD